MPDEVVTPATPETPVDPETLSPEDYRTLRETGNAPKPTSSAAAEEVAKTEPESETGEEVQEHQDPAPKKKGGFQRRIDQLTREKAALEARLAGQPAGTAEEKKPEPKPAAAEGKPQVANFESYEAFSEALTDWKLDQREKARVEADTAAKAQVEQQTAAQKWNEQLEGARDRYEDFDEVALSDAPISQAVHAAIVGSENGTDLAYYLGQNPAERERINKLAPTAATLALGKILAKLEGAEATPEDTKPKVSAAPAPIKPLGSKSVIAGKRPEDMTNAEYRIARESGKIR